eukprot:9073037-Pyramimonas_sp.AAC.1
MALDLLGCAAYLLHDLSELRRVDALGKRDQLLLDLLLSSTLVPLLLVVGGLPRCGVSLPLGLGGCCRCGGCSSLLFGGVMLLRVAEGFGDLGVGLLVAQALLCLLQERYGRSPALARLGHAGLFDTGTLLLQSLILPGQEGFLPVEPLLGLLDLLLQLLDPLL